MLACCWCQDIYPFLVEASTGVALAHCPDTQAASRTTAECTEGFSLLPLVPMLDSPKAPPTKPAWKRQAAHSQFPRSCGKHAPCEGNALSLDIGVMGYTQRLDKYRYVSI